MRKVTQSVCEAFKQGRRLTVGNSSTDGTTLFLHGNAIARKNGDRLEISFAGWPSMTTAERIRGVLWLYESNCGVGVSRTRRAAYFWPARARVGESVDPSAWITVPDVSL